jgi:GntR family transcriptional regulator
MEQVNTEHGQAEDSAAKYLQISSEIIRRIRSGELAPGMKVPSENEIIHAYGVSNTTARKALQQIELQGYARRYKGRGTFVEELDVVRSATKILSFTQNMRQEGLTPSTRLLHAGTVHSECTVHIQDRPYVLHPPVYKIHRLRFADDVPVLLEVRYVSSMLCPGIVEENLEGSLYEIYEDRYGLHLTEIKQKLKSIILDSSSMEFFNLSELTPGLLIEGVTFCGRQTPLELERSIYRGDKYQFTVTATS